MVVFINNFLKFCIGIGILFASLALAYYLVIFLPQKESTRKEEEANRMKEENREQAIIQDCHQESFVQTKEAYEDSESKTGRADFIEFVYKSCLREKGLNP
jgi:hypothetical protein